MSATPQDANDAALSLFRDLLADGYTLVCVHVYDTEAGEPLFYRARFAHPSNLGKQIRPFHWAGTRWRIGEPKQSPRPLYGLSRLAGKRQHNVHVIVVEGEKVADALNSFFDRTGANFTAVTSGSSSSAKAADWKPLEGLSCLVWPDNDEPGAKYADAVITSLRGCAAAVERVDVAALDLPPRGDAFEWLEANPDAGADAMTKLPRAVVNVANTPAPEGPRVILTRGDTIQLEPVDWLWWGWLAAGKLHILAGSPGTGKTTIALSMAAIISRGGKWPDGTDAPLGSVVIWSGEDDPADTLAPRLRAMNADMGRIHFVSGVAVDEGKRPFDPAGDVGVLAQTMADLPDVRLLVVDPIVSAVAGDGHTNTETRRSLQPLVDLAASRQCALIGITHLSKGTSGRDPVERVSGSLAFGAVARVVLLASKQAATDDTPERRLLMRAKSNIGPDSGAFAYDLVQVDVTGHEGMQASALRWGEAVDGAARDLMAEAEQPSEAGRKREPAAEWLKALLSLGPRTREDVRRLAEAEGFTWRTMERAMTSLGVESKRSGYQGAATWSLPIYATVTPFAPLSECGGTGVNGGVNGGTGGGEFTI